MRCCRGFVFALVALCGNGCASIETPLQFEQSLASADPATQQTIRRVQPGMSLEEVERILGAKGFCAVCSSSGSYYSFNLPSTAKYPLDARFTLTWEGPPHDYFERWCRDPWTGKCIEP